MSTINLDLNESSLSSCSSSPPLSLQPIHTDTDSTVTLKINKALSMGYDYDLIQSVLDEQNDQDDMSKFIETIVRKAEMNQQYSTTSPSPIIHESDSSEISHDVYIIDGADLAYSFGNNSFSWRGIEICLKYFHSHGHKKVYIVLPYTLKHHRHDQFFLESKYFRDIERKNLLIYTNRSIKQSNASTHINEIIKFSQKTKGYLITNVSFKDILLDFTIYKKILEEKIIRYRFQSDPLNNIHFQPLLVRIKNNNSDDCELYYPLCPYGKKCTYGLKCKYFHIERRYEKPLSISENLQMKAQVERTRIQSRRFNQTKSGPEHLHMYASNLVDDAKMDYQYGLTSTPVSNEFTFVDQRYLNQAYSIPQLEQQQQIYPIEYDYSSVNNQQGLADKIQSVRHLWEQDTQNFHLK